MGQVEKDNWEFSTDKMAYFFNGVGLWQNTEVSHEEYQGNLIVTAEMN